METLGGFPNLPAMLRWRRSRQAPHALVMETLGGFPNLGPYPPPTTPARFARPRRDAALAAKPPGFARVWLARTAIDLVQLMNNAG